MSKELIERLRADAESTDDIGLCADAADRIEDLERKVASRDAEVARLKAIPVRYRRMAFNAQLQDEIAELKELIRLIFESTPPYREDGSYVFTDAVIDKWKELRQ